eukprot:4388174-Heterocapsa_arctica.AAC.1
MPRASFFASSRAKPRKHRHFDFKQRMFGHNVDVMDMGTTVEPMRYGLGAIGNFTDIGHVVPMTLKQADNM